MYLNTFICLEENISGYSKNDKELKGHVSISSPGIIKCYVQDLNKTDQEYIMYVVSKSANKAVRIGKLNHPMMNRQTAWKITLDNVGGAGLHAKDIDCVVIVVEGHNIGNTDMVMLGYTKDKYLVTSMIQHALPKKEKPTPKPAPIPTPRPMPKPQIQQPMVESEIKGNEQQNMKQLTKELKLDVIKEEEIQPDMKICLGCEKQKTKEIVKQKSQEQIDQKVQEIKELELDVIKEELQLEQETFANEQIVEQIDALGEVTESTTETCPCQKHTTQTVHEEKIAVDSSYTETKKEMIDQQVKDQLEQKLKEFMSSTQNKNRYGNNLEEELKKQVSEVLQQNDVAKKIGQNDRNLKAQIGVIVSDGLRGLDLAVEEFDEEEQPEYLEVSLEEGTTPLEKVDEEIIEVDDEGTLEMDRKIEEEQIEQYRGEMENRDEVDNSQVEYMNNIQQALHAFQKNMAQEMGKKKRSHKKR